MIRKMNKDLLPHVFSVVFCHLICQGCQLQATQNTTKMQNTTLETYGKLSLFIFLTSYQHLGSKGAKFCVLWSISTDHLNHAECGHYEIQKMYGTRHIVRDIMMPWTVRMVGLCINTGAADSQKPTWSQIIRVVWECIIKNTYKQPGGVTWANFCRVFAAGLSI